ncbi:SRPBCC domain-containing protein [Agromyces sp. NPDC049794]|uniref:SRPBCC domain-containing protein n=1 Tax=unclassified Agromyces TaxID=2639701 RepID=UPI0033F3A5CF
MTTTTTQIYHVFIRATAEEVWEAITRPEHTVRYFYGASIDTTEHERINRGPDGSDWGTEAVLEFDPPRRLVHEWRSGYDEELAAEPASRVTWEISPSDDGTCLVTLTHDRLEGSPKTAEGVEGTGWMYVLSALKTVLESGASLVKSP